MANIDKELEAIQNAVYGEEVRSSIYNGIKAVNDSAVDSAQVCVTKAEEASSSAANAESSASSATTKATESEQSATMARSYATGGTGAREGEDVDNAKYYMEQAKEISQVEIATTEMAGIVKPDGNTIEVDVDGTIKIPDATKEAKGVVKLSDSEDVTDSTGLALPATEKNASIEGTLAHEIAELNSSFDRKTLPETATNVKAFVVFATNTDGSQCYSSSIPLPFANQKTITLKQVATPWFGADDVSNFTILKGMLEFHLYANNSTMALKYAGKSAEIIFDYS